MKVFLSTIACFILLGNINAQEKIGLDHRLVPIDKGETAIYYLTSTQNDNGLYSVILYYIDMQILMRGNSIDKLGQELDGESVWFYKNGSIQSEGLYKNGQKQGTWKRYNEDGSVKSDRHYSEVSMDNIVFNSALYMPKPQVESQNFNAYINSMIKKDRLFDLYALSPIAIQVVITNEGVVSDKKYDDRLSMDDMKVLDDYISAIPSWKPGSNGTQEINVRVNYSVKLSTD